MRYQVACLFKSEENKQENIVSCALSYSITGRINISVMSSLRFFPAGCFISQKESGEK